jgi:AcrR family transcriptional regulator
MGTLERRAREKDAKRRSILHAAIRCFGKHGYDATTLDDVGRQAEVAKGTLYLYFRSKADLFASLLMDQGFEVFSSAIDETLSPGKKPTTALRDFASRFQELCLDGRKEIFEFFIQLDRGDISRDLSPDLRQEARRRLEHILSQVARVVDEGRKSGEFVGPEGRRVALVLWAVCVGVAHLAKGGYRAPEVLGDAITILLRGLVPK